MFTGIVEELGTVISVDGQRLRIGAEAVLEGVTLGDSTSVNGVCLTVVTWGQGWWEADISPETFARSTIGSLRRGDRVNLERPVRPTDRLGGHIVQGHVDGVGEIVGVVPDLGVKCDQKLMRYVIEKGSVAVDGVSLTVVDVLGDGFTCAIIPHTSKATTLGLKALGDLANIEVDMVAKYVESMLKPYAKPC